MLLALLLSCTAVDPAQVRAEVLAGDLDGAAALLTEAEQPQLAALAELATRWQVAEEERRTLSRASRELLRDTVEQRLHAGDLDGALGPLAAALDAWPDDPAFLQLAHDLGTAAEDAPPETALAAMQAVSELLVHDPARARIWAQRADAVALLQRYAPDRLARTRVAQAGITRDAAVQLLTLVDREYIDEPNWLGAGTMGRARLRTLAHDAGALLAWPKLADVTFPESSVDPVASLDAALAAGTAAGVPEDVLVYEWIDAALGFLDPWTRAVWPAEIASWEAHHAGVQVGVGLELDQAADGTVVVARPLPDTPAWSGDVRQGDQLLALSDPTGRLDLVDLPVDQRLPLARRALVGRPGSPVTLHLQRGDQVVQTTLSRAPVVRETVQGYARGSDNAWSVWLDAEAGLAYVRIEAFRDASEPDFDALLEPFLGQLSGLVLDLRGNPGGDIDAAVQVADRFVADGWLARISGRVLPETGPDVDPETGKRLAEWNQALPGHALEGTPLVVLVDHGTASAAEVLAGALQERAGAVVVGAPTWGKGYAQKLHTDPDGRWAVQLTNLAWTTPDGRRLVHDGQVGPGGGILPDVSLPAASPGEDFQLAWMLAQRTALRVHADGSPMQPVGTPPRQDLPSLSEDPVLLAGELVLRGVLLDPQPE